MSNKRRKKSVPSRPADPPVLTMKDPGDIVATIPYLLGFVPTESLVVVSLEGPRKRFGPCLRIDLADDAADIERLADYVVGVADHHHFSALLLVAFSERAELAALAVNIVLTSLASVGITVSEALRADGKRWWSYTCREAGCCSPDGTPYDESSSPACAEAVLHGLAKAANRDSLRALFAPAPESERMAMAAACRALKVRSASPRRWTPAEMEQQVNAALKLELDRRGDLPMADAAALLVAAQRVRLRDAAWMMMTRDNAADHLELWRQVTRLAPDALLAPAGCLAGFAAWISGKGVLASHASDRVAEVAPAYSMGALLRDALDQLVHPDLWASVRGAS